MRKLALAVALLCSSRVALAVDFWDQDRSADIYGITFPRGNAYVSPCATTPCASIVTVDNSGAVYDAIRFTGGGIPRILNADLTDTIIGSSSGPIDFAAGGVTHVQFINTGDALFGQSGGNLVSPGMASTSSGGFFYIGTAHGPPTAVPVSEFNGGVRPMVPLVFDDLDNELWYYDFLGSAWVAIGSGAGTVTSVNGTAGRITVVPTTPNPVVDLATFGTASTCTYATTVTDAWGRTACTSGATPQPAGNYITALTHDVTASGPGSASAEVTGITDVGSADWQVTGAFSNGKALGFVAGGLQAVSFQAPLSACVDYVSLSCVSGATDLGGTNATPTVTGVEAAATVRGDVVVTNTSTPSLPAGGTTACYADSTAKDWTCINDGGTVTHGTQTVSCSTNAWVKSSSDDGNLTCTQPAFSNLTGSATCAQLPALTGGVTSSAGSCTTTVASVTCAAEPALTGVISSSAGSCTTAYVGLPTASQVMVSTGLTTTPAGDSTYTFDRVAHVQAAGNAVAVNGVSMPTNACLVTGHTTDANRDRVQMFVGGGALGQTGTGDNTFVEIIPAGTNVRAGVTNGIYATARIENLTYTGVSSPTIREAASLYIDGQPTLTSVSTIDSVGKYAIYSAGGNNRFAGTVIADTLSTFGGPKQMVVANTSGTLSIRPVMPETIHYHMDIPAWPINQGWISTSQPAKFYNGTAIEYPVAHVATNVTLVANLIANGLTTSGVTAVITQNGSSVIGAVFNMSTGTSTGVYSSGPIALLSSSSTDTFGVNWTNSATGSVDCTFTVIID